MTSTRQLAAIMFTDIVGYTALMGKDEPKAMELVRKNREVQKPLIEKYNGSLLKEMGDGNLASFPTASDAIYCAREIQQALHEDSELNLRIGIHLGEIRIEGGDIYGDGVNVASRLESIAEPGGIYISDTVQKSIRSQPDIQTAYLGELELKNVDYAVKTYAIRGEGLPRPKKTAEKHLSGRLMAELQRRNVHRASLAYFAVAFIIYSLMKFIEIGSNFQNVIFGALILGIPISMYLAWNYERSPDGFVRVTSRKAWVNPYTDTQKKPFTGNGMIIFLLVAIVVLLAYPQFKPRGSGSEELFSASEISEKSIAVLHFENMSNDPEQEYFSNGITEDILNHLAKIEDLRVKSRTSTLQYKGSTKSIPEIGSELGVTHVLEGSVRKAGDQVRITAQLIDVLSDDHLWSESYDRDLKEIFAIQTEVAKEIVRVLELKLSAQNEKNLMVDPTADITAYDYFLRARELFINLNSNSNFSRPVDTQSIIELLQEAISMDPDFAEAYALLSRVLYQRGYFFSREIWLDSALTLANRSIELAPEVADGYVIRALIIGWSFGEEEKAGKDFEKAYELEPNDPFVLARLGGYLIDNNNPERGVPLIIKSIELSYGKKDPQYYVQWGNIYRNAGELSKASELYQQAEKLAPEWNVPKNQLGNLNYLEENYLGAIEYFMKAGNNDAVAWNYYRSGNLDKAEEYWLNLLKEEQSLEDTTAYFAVRHRLGMVNWEQGEKDQAMNYFTEQIRLNQRDIDQNQIPVWIGSLRSSKYDLAVTKAYMGQTEEAMNIIENEDIYWGDVFTMTDYLEKDPMLKSVRNHPQFVTITDNLRNKSEAASKVYRKIILEREATEQMKFGLEK